MSNKQYVLNLISDGVSNMLYYDRKEDPELPVGAIEKMVKEGEIDLDAMFNEFMEALTEGCK